MSDDPLAGVFLTGIKPKVSGALTGAFQKPDVRIPADPQDYETTRARMAIPPVEFTVAAGATVNTFTIQDRQFVPQRGSTASYRIYFLPAAFSPIPVGQSLTVGQSQVLQTTIRTAGQRVASLVAEVPSRGRGDVLKVTDSQFVNQDGYYYCTAVNGEDVEAPTEHIVSTTASTPTTESTIPEIIRLGKISRVDLNAVATNTIFQTGASGFNSCVVLWIVVSNVTPLAPTTNAVSYGQLTAPADFLAAAVLPAGLGVASSVARCYPASNVATASYGVAIPFVVSVTVGGAATFGDFEAWGYYSL